LYESTSDISTQINKGADPEASQDYSIKRGHCTQVIQGAVPLGIKLRNSTPVIKGAVPGGQRVQKLNKSNYKKA